ncbi:hypothetical protein NQ317_016425 [Molorchus minor]|uniref:Acyl-CoA dehydrogenase family member 9, mitochondrial n=1 Tax=Molorchus minor TaxID=1323400 RepID=A0ABQ9JZ67_9CUCU|nr:hypothetical protein NQ317_016425 [Molorchus minor]
MISVRLRTCNRLFEHRALFKTVLFNNSTSTQPAVINRQEEYERQLKEFDTLTNITRKVRTKKPQRPPFAKSLFVGVFDTEVLTYPQLEKEDLESLEQNVAPLEKLLIQNHMVDCDSLSNKFFRQNLADQKAIGLQASQFLDGRECNLTESSRFLEALSTHRLRDNLIYNEQFGVQSLVKFASDNLKKKYLHPLMTGESLSAFCISEAVLSDLNSLKTTATLSPDKKTWVLNGEKTWVVNGASADTLIVLAVSEVISRDVIKETKLTAFVVEKDFPGVSVETIDADLEVANVTFNDTPIPSENVIGEVNKAESIIRALLMEFRLSAGPTCITLFKQIHNNLTKSILEQSNDFTMLHETDAIRGKLGEATMWLYAMESMLYLTTGLLDSYENQDCELESTIVKVFCSQKCSDISMVSLDLIGTAATSESHWTNQLHKESLRYLTLHETNDSLKMIIALLGLQFAGAKMNELVRKLRNPMYYGAFILKRLWTTRKNASDDPKLDLDLGSYLHPSIIPASKQLEYSVKRLEFATETLLDERHGAEVVNMHMDLRRLADCIIDIYAMTACLSRASRSYCIGLQNSNYEMVIAATFCYEAMERVRHNVQKIFMGYYHTNDQSYRTISKNVIKFKRYFPKHPLARNF